MLRFNKLLNKILQLIFGYKASNDIIVMLLSSCAKLCANVHAKVDWMVLNVVGLYRREGRCGPDKLLNLDICECCNSEAVDMDTCRTKSGYNSSELWGVSSHQYYLSHIPGELQYGYGVHSVYAHIVCIMLHYICVLN